MISENLKINGKIEEVIEYNQLLKSQNDTINLYLSSLTAELEEKKQ